MRRYLMLAFTSGLLALSSVSASAQATIKVAEGSRNFNVLPLYVADHFGYFTEQGIKVELITLKGGPAAANALLSGDVDVALTIVETVIKLRQQGKHVKVGALLQDHNPCVIAIPAKSDAKKLSDLKGKSIGVTAIGSLTETVLRGYVTKEGMASSDFKVVAFGQPSTVNLAMERGEVDAAVTVTPFLTSLELGNKGKVLVDFRPEIYPGQSIVVREDDATGPKRELYKKFYAALQKGMDKMYADPDGAITATKKFFPNIAGDLLSAAVKDDVVKHRMFAKNLKVSEKDFDTWQASLVKNDVLKSGLKYDEVFAKAD